MNSRGLDSEFLDYGKGDEQSNLIAIMENNEKILNLSQITLAKDKQNLMQELRSTESLYKVQVKSLSEENKAYQQEITRLNQKVTILTEKLEDLNQELKKTKEKNAIIGHSLLETSQKFVKIEDKCKKLEKFYKEKEGKLQEELKKTQSSLSVIESDFSKKLENFTEKPVKSLDKTLISKDQVTILIQQKKEIEKNFLQEKKNLNEELKSAKKKIRELEKMLESEKQAKNTCEVQIRVLKSKEQQILSIKDSESAMMGSQILELENAFRDKTLQMEVDNLRREEEYLSALQGLQDEFEDYKIYAEELIKTQNTFKDFGEVLDVLSVQFNKLRKMKKSISVHFDCVGKAVKEFYSLTPYTIPPETPSEYNSEYLKTFEELKNLIKTVKNYQNKLEKQSQSITNSIEAHSEELVAAEKQKISEFFQLSNENHSLSTQVQELIQAKTKKLDSGDQNIKMILENLKISQDLVQNLKKKLNSFKVKQNSDLAAWSLRENLYKKTIKSLNSQLELQNSQFVDYKKLVNLESGTLELHLNELRKEMFDKNLMIEVLKKDLSTLHGAQKEAEQKFLQSVRMVEVSNNTLVEFYSTGIDLISKIKKEMIN